MGITRHPIIIFFYHISLTIWNYCHIFWYAVTIGVFFCWHSDCQTWRVCYQSSITWGKAGNYLQSVSSNTVMICDKPVKITNVLLFAEIEIHRKQKWSFNYYICTTSWQPAELQTNGNSVCMSTVTAVSPSQTESLCICFPVCNILTVF